MQTATNSNLALGVLQRRERGIVHLQNVVEGKRGGRVQALVNTLGGFNRFAKGEGNRNRIELHH